MNIRTFGELRGEAIRKARGLSPKMAILERADYVELVNEGLQLNTFVNGYGNGMDTDGQLWFYGIRLEAADDHFKPGWVSKASCPFCGASAPKLQFKCEGCGFDGNAKLTYL